MTTKRPYSRLKNTEPSVTTVLEELGKPGLRWGASRETAMYAVLHPEEWQHLPESEAVTKLSRHHDGIWKSRAAIGTVVHAVAEEYANNRDVDIEALIQDMLENDRDAQLWKQETFDDLLERVLGYVLGVEKWFTDFQPHVVATETIVRKPGVHIGTTDLVSRIRARWPSDGRVATALTICDWKTTASQDDNKGFYADSYSLQLHAYALSTEVVEYEEYETPKGTRIREVGTKPWVTPDRLAVVHLRGDESYGFYEIPFHVETYERFLDLCNIHAWRKRLPTSPASIEPAKGAA